MESINYISVEQTPSTNDLLLKMLNDEALPEGFVVSTLNQSNGKGQAGNTWESAPEKNLTFSMLLRPEFLAAESMFMISKVVSLGIIDYLNNYDKRFTIKWPNDIYYMDKKVGGILIENQLIGNSIKLSVVGIGVNINQEKFNGDAPNPISIKTILNRELNIEHCMTGIINQITIWYELLRDGFNDRINESYFCHLYRNNGYFDFTDKEGQFHAKIKHVREDGQLVLKTPTGALRKYYFKEVEYVI